MNKIKKKGSWVLAFLSSILPDLPKSISSAAIGNYITRHMSQYEAFLPLLVSFQVCLVLTSN